MGRRGVHEPFGLVRDDASHAPPHVLWQVVPHKPEFIPGYAD